MSIVSKVLALVGLWCLGVGLSRAVADDDKVLNVHIVPHTHDDVGWLKTVEQYFYGWNSTIQKAHVESILDTVISELIKNSNRTFTYVEVKFFSMWWGKQSDSVKEMVKSLVGNGQFSFANGGWCMHDEATTHYMGMIDQTTLGHRFLKKELGIVPTVGWQLDPFGHSATQASLLTAQVGFDALYFGRIDYQDLQIRQATQECEGLWSSSPNLNDTVFWGLTGSYNGNYGSPSGFNFDIHSNDQPLVGLDRDHLIARIKDFLAKIKVQSDRTKDNNIMLTMGTDFEYEQASKNFQNLDLLIKSVIEFQASGDVDVPTLMGPRFGSINIFYSTPEQYTKQKYEATMRQTALLSSVERRAHESQTSLNAVPTSPWSVKTDDFFPYADCPHCYWTGYFTSRTGLKRLERVASSFLLAARQIESAHESHAPSDCECDSCPCRPLDELDDALGVAQHHDGVSGTAKQHVANDYAKRIQAGIDKASSYVEQKLKRLLLNDTDSIDLRFCQLLNESTCEVSETLDKGSELLIVVYNGLAFFRSTIIGIPLTRSGSYRVVRGGRDAEHDRDEIVQSATISHNDVGTNGKYMMYFDTGPLPPIGATVFRLVPVSSSFESQPQPNGVSHVSQSRLRGIQGSIVDIGKSTSDNDMFSLSNGPLTVQFRRSTGELLNIKTDEDNGFNLNISQEWGYYKSFDSDRDKANPDSQNSGAYIFRPSVKDQSLEIISPELEMVLVYKTDIVMEVHIAFEQPWIKQVTRLVRGQRYVEVEYTIGPIPFEDQVGKEIVTRYSSPIKSKKEFYTDSNGREFLRRKRSYRPTWALNETEPVAGNYYPINTAAYIEDEHSSLSIVVDRSQGGTSLADGSIELMVQRRTLADDKRGVNEPMNETDGGITPYPPYGNATRVGDGVVIKGKHRILIGKGRAGAHLARSEIDKMFMDPLVFVASTPSDLSAPVLMSSYSALNAALPDNVMLLTFSLLHDAPATTFLIRLGHQYGKGEHEELSKPVKVDMSKLLKHYEVISMVEKTLSGNRDYSEWENQRLHWSCTNSDASHERPEDDGFVVQLNPMEIRTFEVYVREEN